MLNYHWYYDLAKQAHSMPHDPPEHTEPSCGLSRSLLGTGKGGGVKGTDPTVMAHPVRVFPSHTGRSSPRQNAPQSHITWLTPFRVLPSPISHGSPRQNAPQSHSILFTMLDFSPAPRHMAHHVRVLPSPIAVPPSSLSFASS